MNISGRMPAPRVDRHVAAILVSALVLRLAVWWTLPYNDWISDEAEYWNAAAWLASGQGFAFFDGWIWTRPPLYLLFLAAHIKLFGPTGMWAARLTQALLGVLLVWLVMRLAWWLAPGGGARRVALISGWAMALSYSFASYAFFLLGETFFLVLFVAALLALLRWRGGAHPNLGWLVVAGVLFGLCALTKAIVLTFMPIVALWVLVSYFGPHPPTPFSVASDAKRGDGGDGPTPSPRHPLIAVLILTLSVCAIVLPWSAYATLRWGRGDGVILVDTTGGYNFALGAQSAQPGGRNENALHDQLCGGIQCGPDQAKRQAEAYALGWRLILDNPAGFARKTGRELLDMLLLQYSGAERLRAGYTVGDVPAPHLLGLLLDDALYAVAAPLAVLGLLRRQCRPGKGLVVGWLVYNIAVGALVFVISRFRQPLLPFIYIYAACAVARWRVPWNAAGRRWTAYAGVALALLLIWPTFVYWGPNLYWPPIGGFDRRSMLYETWLGFGGLRDAQECRAIEALLRGGDVAGARALHDAADVRKPRGCLALINARLLEAEGKVEGEDGALAFLARSAGPGNPRQASRVLMVEGDLYRRLGREREAMERFVAPAVENANDLEWAVAELRPTTVSRIDLGSGLDWGSITGFGKRDGRAEDAGNFRWSGPRSTLRFSGAGTGAPQMLTLRVNACLECWPRRAMLTASAGGQSLPSVELQRGWQEVAFELPATAPGEDVVVTLDNPVFAPGPDTLAVNMRSQVRQPLQLLGVQLDWAELTPKNQGTKEPKNQRTKEPKNQRTREPRNQRTREPGNQRTREPRATQVPNKRIQGSSTIETNRTRQYAVRWFPGSLVPWFKTVGQTL